MTSREHRLGVLRIVATLGFSDEELWRQRQNFVAHSGLEEAAIVAHCGFLHAERVVFAGRHFDLVPADPGAEPAFLIGALDRHETMIDVIAWPIGRPTEVASYGGVAAVLTPKSIPEQAPLFVHRTPERWLRHGFAGLVVLDPRLALPILIDTTSSALAVEDTALGNAIFKTARFIGAAPPRILAPSVAA